MVNNSLVAYVTDYSGSFDIWLYDINSTVDVQLTNRLAGKHTVPYWSPDGSHIAFVGRNLIVYVVNIASGKIARIDQLVEGEIHTLDWSRDGKRLAYTKQDAIIFYNIVSHQAQIIREPGPTDVQWFPDGTTVLFQSSKYTGISQLFRISIDQTSIQQLTINEQGPLNHVRLSKNGRYVLYTSPGVSISIIYTLDLLTGQLFEVQGGPLAKNYYPEWAPNSMKLAYSATALLDEEYVSLVRTVGYRGEGDRTWALSECFATPVTWSSDSKKLIYLSRCKSEAFASEMWFVDFNDPVPIPIITGRKITSAKWSPK
jgi:TolB protein